MNIKYLNNPNAVLRVSVLLADVRRLFIIAAVVAASFLLFSGAASARQQQPTEEKMVETVSPYKQNRSKRIGGRRALEMAKSSKRSSRGKESRKEDDEQSEQTEGTKKQRSTRPIESRLNKAGTFDGDLRDLPKTKIIRKERPEREEPRNPNADGDPSEGIVKAGTGLIKELMAPAPAPIATFIGLDFQTWGAGRPPDTNGDVGKDYFIQSVNSSIGIYKKSDGTRVAAFTLNNFMKQGNFGNLCDTDNFGDPVVLYDTFEDRWIITDFAFKLDASNNVVNPPGNFQCFAASKTGDPVAGGWNFYSVNTTGGLGDYPKLGVWNDGIYMMVNMFGYPSGGAFQNTRVYALNKAQMYAGKPSVQIISFNAPSDEFTILPANARLQTGAPPVGAPNYFSVVWKYTNVISVYKFHADWDRISLSTFTGPFDTFAPASWASAPATVPAQGGNANDTLATRLMAQNQYTNIGGVESLWNTHTVLGAAGQSAVRYYQVPVTGGTAAASTTQAFTYNPDTTIHRYASSIGVNRAGDMAIGYTASNATLFASMRYAGRLAGDPVNTITQSETDMFAGAGGQTSSTRWGDYSSMTLDPDGCTFWQTSEYYAANGTNWQTRIGSFTYPSCVPVGAGGTVSGTVTAASGGAAISGATVKFGSRTTTTDGSGNYSFTGIPAGTYTSIAANYPGNDAVSATTIAVTDGGTTTKNFVLPTTPTSASLTDTTTADFQLGVGNNTDLASSSGNTTLLDAPAIDQQNTTVSTSGFGFNNTSWLAQTFTAAVTGKATQVDVDLFCSACTGTPPNIIVSIRNTASDLPTGADIATATAVPLTTSNAGGFYSVSFPTPATLTAGTKYAIVVRMSAAYATGTPAYVTSASTGTSANPYAGGRRATSSNSGGTWTGASATASNDIGFKVTMKAGYAASGDLTSGLKDANPAPGRTVSWDSLTWNATVPASTTLRFQLAASNSDSGPFVFVGPDGTSGTYYTTSGSTLAPILNIPTAFNNNRYLKYKAYFTSTDVTATPILNDVTVSYTAAPAAPTAGMVTVGGRAVSSTGRGIKNVIIQMTDTNGNVRTAVTSAFGYYRFTDVAAGETYIFMAKGKRFTFNQPTQVLNATEDTMNVNFVAIP